MNGQWIGTYDGATKGAIHVNVDEEESNFSGVAYLFTDTPELPPSVAYFVTPDKSQKFSFRTSLIQAIDRETTEAVPWSRVQSKYGKDVIFSTYADVTGTWDRDALELNWTTDTGVTGHGRLLRSQADQPSALAPLSLDWEGYKAYVSRLVPRRLLFRGQNGTWRLRTSFHRSGRADLHRFVFRDVPEVHRHLSARTKHVFKLGDNEEYGAFLNLIQHHGYPTPSLDWTYSPYVAAFFAYRGIGNKQADAADSDAKVRIYVFDSAAWTVAWAPVTLLIHPQLHLTVREFIAIENERMIPQQAVSTITSIDDIEAYVRLREKVPGDYLRAIDLPVRERRHVVSELVYMGITAGALFPGLDGACQELAERNFGR